MTPGDPFLQGDLRVLTPEAFDFVLDNELKRAVRSQNFLTLLVLEPTPDVSDTAAQETLLEEVTRLVSREVRETDLVALREKGQLSIVLLDADLQNSMQVVDRLVSRFRHYAFRTPLAIEVRAATCPTHGTDAETLRLAAQARPVHPRRDDRGSASKSN